MDKDAARKALRIKRDLEEVISLVSDVIELSRDLPSDRLRLLLEWRYSVRRALIDGTTMFNKASEAMARRPVLTLKKRKKR